MKTHEVVQKAIEALRPAPANARVHSKKQIKQIARSIQRYGFNAPVLVGDDGEIIAGHGRVEAARLLGPDTVPTICLAHLSAIERRAYLSTKLQGRLPRNKPSSSTRSVVAKLVIPKIAATSFAAGPKKWPARLFRFTPRKKVFPE